MKDIILVENIDKTFKDKEVFCDFSLSIREKTVHALVGPNGSGKTSLLRILTGITSARVMWKSRGPIPCSLKMTTSMRTRLGWKI